jgi:hypothetical protein
MKFFQTIAYSLTTWLLAALVNGLLFALFFAISLADTNGMVSFIPIVIGALIFSAPGIFCFWLFFYISVYSGKSGQPLFRALLAVGCICAGFCGLGAGFLFGKYLNVHWMIMGAMAVVAAGISLFLHRGSLIFIHQPSTNQQHV